MITLATLEELRLEWRDAHDNMVAETADLVAQRDALNENITVLEKPHRDRLKQLEEAMRPLVTPETPPKGHGVKIAYRKGYKKTNWDGKKLEGFMIAEPRLEHFKKTVEVKPSISFSRDED